MDDYLSTHEAATLVGVAPSSIKRLADEGLLACIRTAGGHRRYARASLEAFLRRRSESSQPFAAAWVERLVRGDRFEVEAEMLRLRARLGSWTAVADQLGPVLSELGAAWQRGDIMIADEHRAAECFSRAVDRIGSSLPGTPQGPQGLLACASGDDHTLALSLAELCLREQGWTPVWLGRHTPTSELVRLLKVGQARLVALSASTSSKGRRELSAAAAEVGAACQAAGATLVLGGSGAWPEAPQYGVRLRSFTEFSRLLASAGRGE
jgi:MerR family transcriptional regulator, light-induced transcriptional regulator